MNGHFASVGAEPGAQDYEHGVQVIDDQKEFKYDIPWTHTPARKQQPAARSSRC